MTLVDAAASLLDKKSTLQAPVTPDSTAKIPTAVEVVTAPLAPSINVIFSPNDSTKKQSFAELLMTILDDPQYEDALTWMPDGKAFTIKNHKKFTQDLMPKLFNIRNMSSFVRKLGRWGFSRVHEKETRNSDIFKHPNFHKDNWELCLQVKCIGSLQAKPSPSPPRKAVLIDLVAMDSSGRPHPHPTSPVVVSPHSDIIDMGRIPSPPTLVTPPSANKAMFRLEQARRLSARSRPSAFGGNKGLGDMTNEVMEAAIETLRRDEETVIVAMPKKYLQTTHRPGMRVLSSGFSPPPAPHHPAAGTMVYHPHHPHPHPHHPRSPYHQQHQQKRPRSSVVMQAPVSLNIRPTNLVMYNSNGQRMVPKGWAYTNRPGYPSAPSAAAVCRR